MSDRAAAKPWSVPAIGAAAQDNRLTAARLEALQREAYDEAFEKGYAEGIERGEAEIATRAGRLEALLNALATPFETLDDEVEAQLVDLAFALTRQLFRREIKLDPTHIVGVVHEAIRLLPVASQNIELHLHPDDAALLRETLTASHADSPWHIVEDPTQTRGGLVVTTTSSRIDATAESRLDAVIAAVAGDERRP